MNDDLRIMRDQVKSLLITVEKLVDAVDVTTLSPDLRELVTLAIEEAREALGELSDCAAGTCRL